MGIRVSRERGRPARSGPQAHGRSSGRDARAPGNPARGIGTAYTSSFLGEVARSLPVEMPGARSSRQTCLDCDKRIGTRLAKPAKVNDPIIPYRCELGAAIGNSVLDTSFWPTVAQVYLSRTVNLVRIVERNRELNAFGIGTYAKNKIEVRRGECAAKPGGFPDFHRINVLTKPPLRFGNRTWFGFRPEVGLFQHGLPDGIPHINQKDCELTPHLMRRQDRPVKCRQVLPFDIFRKRKGPRVQYMVDCCLDRRIRAIRPIAIRYLERHVRRLHSSCRGLRQTSASLIPQGSTKLKIRIVVAVVRQRAFVCDYQIAPRDPAPIRIHS